MQNLQLGCQGARLPLQTFLPVYSWHTTPQTFGRKIPYKYNSKEMWLQMLSLQFKKNMYKTYFCNKFITLFRRYTSSSSWIFLNMFPLWPKWEPILIMFSKCNIMSFIKGQNEVYKFHFTLNTHFDLNSIPLKKLYF